MISVDQNQNRNSKTGGEMLITFYANLAKIDYANCKNVNILRI